MDSNSSRDQDKDILISPAVNIPVRQAVNTRTPRTLTNKTVKCQDKRGLDIRPDSSSLLVRSAVSIHPHSKIRTKTPINTLVRDGLQVRLEADPSILANKQVNTLVSRQDSILDDNKQASSQVRWVRVVLLSSCRLMVGTFRVRVAVRAASDVTSPAILALTSLAPASESVTRADGPVLTSSAPRRRSGVHL